MPINYYTVANHLEAEGWRLLSTSYKNLQDPLEMLCPVGHKQEQTYGEWRKHSQCQLCEKKANTVKIKNNIADKAQNTYRVLALDAASIITGYSIYDDKTLIAYGVHKENSNDDIVKRINGVKKWLIETVHDIKPDLVGIEHIQLQVYKGAYQQSQAQVEVYRKLANLQGVILDAMHELQIPCELVNSSAWRSYLSIDGQYREQKKKATQNKVKLLYDIDCTEDEADAICIGKYFAGKHIKMFGDM